MGTFFALIWLDERAKYNKKHNRTLNKQIDEAKTYLEILAGR